MASRQPRVRSPKALPPPEKWEVSPSGFRTPDIEHESLRDLLIKVLVWHMSENLGFKTRTKRPKK